MNRVGAIPVDVLNAIDTMSSVARYRQIADRLADHVMDARPGTRLPSEPEIVSYLGVSRATAIQALRELERRGLVTRRQGKGTFVADTEPAIRTNERRSLPSFSEDLRRAGHSTRERVIALEIVAADEEIAGHLELPVGADVWRVARVIVSDDEPVVHLTSWLPRDRFPSLTRSRIEETSLYEQLQDVDGTYGRPCVAREQWSAATAPPESARLLELAGSAPVMKVVRTAYLHDEIPAEHSVSFVRGETFAVSMRIDGHRHVGRRLSQLSELRP